MTSNHSDLAPTLLNAHYSNSQRAHLLIFASAALGVHLALALIPAVFSQHSVTEIEQVIRVALTATMEPESNLTEDANPLPLEQDLTHEPVQPEQISEEVEETRSDARINYNVESFVQDLIQDEAAQSKQSQQFSHSYSPAAKGQPDTNVGIEIKEHQGGEVAVRTNLLGQPVCYSFDAQGDPPVAFYSICPEDTPITLNLDQANDW